MHVYTAITEQHKGMSEGCGKGMDKAPTCFKALEKKKNVQGLVWFHQSLKKVFMKEMAFSFFSRKREIAFQKGTPLF